jgi:hypothetical protein
MSKPISLHWQKSERNMENNKFHIAGCLLSTALCVWSRSYYKHRRNGPNRRQDPEEMDAFLVHLPHVSINIIKEIRLVTLSL